MGSAWVNLGDDECYKQRDVAFGPQPTNQSVRKALGKCGKNLAKTQHLSVACREKHPILPSLFICRYSRCVLTTPDSLAIWASGSHPDAVAPIVPIQWLSCRGSRWGSKPSVCIASDRVLSRAVSSARSSRCCRETLFWAERTLPSNHWMEPSCAARW